MNPTASPTAKHARDMTDADFKVAMKKVIEDGHAARLRADSARALARIEAQYSPKPGAA